MACGSDRLPVVVVVYITGYEDTFYWSKREMASVRRHIALFV